MQAQARRSGRSCAYGLWSMVRDHPTREQTGRPRSSRNVRCPDGRSDRRASESGRKPPQHYAGENVRFNISIAQSSWSGVGQARPARLQLLMPALGLNRQCIESAEDFRFTPEKATFLPSMVSGRPNASAGFSIALTTCAVDIPSVTSSTRPLPLPGGVPCRTITRHRRRRLATRRRRVRRRARCC
jgi:hypothetical protein